MNWGGNERVAAPTFFGSGFGRALRSVRLESGEDDPANPFCPGQGEGFGPVWLVDRSNCRM
jgi:hypothetical protein